jgi:hypothetical protein
MPKKLHNWSQVNQFNRNDTEQKEKKARLVKKQLAFVK